MQDYIQLLTGFRVMLALSPPKMHIRDFSPPGIYSEVNTQSPK